MFNVFVPTFTVVTITIFKITQWLLYHRKEVCGAFFFFETKYKLSFLLRALVHPGNNFVFSNHDHKTVMVVLLTFW